MGLGLRGWRDGLLNVAGRDEDVRPNWFWQPRYPGTGPRTGGFASPPFDGFALDKNWCESRASGGASKWACAQSVRTFSVGWKGTSIDGVPGVRPRATDCRGPLQFVRLVKGVDVRKPQ